MFKIIPRNQIYEDQTLIINSTMSVIFVNEKFSYYVLLCGPVIRQRP
jgi:hypothetical protein